ncbi:unnamed protein product [Cuscuta epithymum]|uniref:MSP domain-containing protein n=1 Tax=Cuscuta epithymum TaxID=186058 RepID=A0AAV0DWJ0_9ASTE|nr:unnamed protein product [Cuscuta epithymum]
MGIGDYLNIYPAELKFPFEVRRQSSCSVQLSNKTDQYVAFKVKTTNPKKYCVRPNAGVVLPNSTCNVTVTMQAPKEAPPDLQCKDKFLIQSTIAPDGATTKDLSAELFKAGTWREMNEFKLRVVYVPANPPSPVPEESEEGSPPRDLNESETKPSPVTQAASRSMEESEEPNEKLASSEAWSLISRLTEEKSSTIQQNQKFHLELEVLKKEANKRKTGGFSVLCVLLVGVIGILVGYFISKS